MDDATSTLLRLLACIVLSIIALALLYTGSVLQYLHGAGIWCILIILGVIFQLIALALYLINQKLRIKDESKVEDEDEDDESHSAEEERSDADQIKIDILILQNQLILYIFGFVYFISGISMLAKNSNVATKYIWLVLVILGLLLLIIVTVLHVLDFPKYQNSNDECLSSFWLTATSGTIQLCIGLGFVFSGTKLLFDSIQNGNFQYIWIFFIGTGYGYHIMNLIFVRNIKHAVQICILILSLVFGLIYTICGVALGVQNNNFGINLWLCVSIPGVLLIFSTAFIFLSTQPFFKHIIRCVCCCFYNKEPKQYFKIDDEEDSITIKTEKEDIPRTSLK